jgi:hypothetical protein
MSDVLLVLDCYIEEMSGGEFEEIKYLSLNDWSWARYGLIFAGYAEESIRPGRFSDYFMSIFEDLAHSEQLVNYRLVARKLMERPGLAEGGMEPIFTGNNGKDNIILAPIIV